MCTAITLNTTKGKEFFGRTMDFSYDIIPSLYVIPNNYLWSNVLTGDKFYNKYSVMGLAQKIDPLMSFFDGFNERGLAGAALYFAGYAHFKENSQGLKVDSNDNAERVSTLDFLQYILGRYSSVSELKQNKDSFVIIGLEDPVTKNIAPLHWIFTDKHGDCVVIESTIDGLFIHDNPLGVMANSPDFKWHMTNIRNYVSVTPTQLEEAHWGSSITLTPFGQGGGTTGLPGGYTSPERFVRVAYLKTHIPPLESTNEVISSFYNIMGNVTIPKGATVSVRDTDDYTRYTSLIDIEEQTYYIKTYNNVQLFKATLTPELSKAFVPTDLGIIEHNMRIPRLLEK